MNRADIVARAVTAGLVGLLVVVLGATSARAFWAATSATPGAGAASVGSLVAGNTPTVTADSNDLTVTWAASLRADGSDVTGYTVQRYTTSNTLQTTLAGCSGTITTTSCTEVDVPDGLWTYAIIPLFRSWTGPQSGKSGQVRSDATAPSVSATRTSTSGSSLLSGSTLYYRGAAAGSFTLTMSVADTGSKAASASTTALTPLTLGWLHIPSNVSTPAGGPYVSNPFSWTAGTTGTLNEKVIGYDASGNATSKTYTLVDDSTGPSGGAISHSTGVQASTSLTLTLGAVSDAGSGLASRVLQRRYAPLTTSTNTCGTYNAWVSIKTSPPSSYAQTLPNNNCYQYQYLLTDNVGNTTTMAGPGVVKVRSYSAVILATGGILDYYRLGETSGSSAADSAVSTTTNTATWYGGPTLGDPGAILGDPNTAVRFDGVDDYAQINRDTTGNANFAIEFWFKSAAGLGTTNSWTDGAGLVDADTTGVANDFGVALMKDGRICAGTGNPDVSACTPQGYADNTWHHVVVNRGASAKALVVYVDGTSRVSIYTTTTAALTDSSYIRFGSLATGLNYYAGSLDEIAVYTNTLSAATISAHYQANQP